MFDASYIVLGLGDVYLGAPVATPLDPRHRLVTTKYNPARTWTPENAVGIGGAYLCVYGMEGPGGYQFVGRTLQVWNTQRGHRRFPRRQAVPPAVLRRDPLLSGRGRELLRDARGVPLRQDSRCASRRARFVTASTARGSAENAASIAEFKRQQQAAFDAERERWRAAGQDVATAIGPAPLVEDAERTQTPPGCSAVTSPIAGSVWKVLAEAGAALKAGDPLVVVEAMKTEIVVASGVTGVVRRVLVAPGAAVMPGQAVAFVEDAS